MYAFQKTTATLLEPQHGVPAKPSTDLLNDVSLAVALSAGWRFEPEESGMTLTGRDGTRVYCPARSNLPPQSWRTGIKNVEMLAANLLRQGVIPRYAADFGVIYDLIHAVFSETFVLRLSVYKPSDDLFVSLTTRDPRGRVQIYAAYTPADYPALGLALAFLKAKVN